MQIVLIASLYSPEQNLITDLGYSSIFFIQETKLLLSYCIS